MNNWFWFTVMVLATGQVVETVRHGSIFAGFRAWLEGRGDFWDELINCGFCFSHWAAIIVVLITCGLAPIISLSVTNPILWPILALAATRTANLINDVTHQFNRTPKSDEID